MTTGGNDSNAVPAGAGASGPGSPELALLGTSEPLLVAYGWGGRVELYRDRIRILRHGLINYLLYLMGGVVAEVDTVIPLERVAAVDVIKPIIWNNYLVVAYPGSPPQRGDTLKDATAENALFLNFLDNRGVYDIIHLMQRLASEPIHVTVATDQSRGVRRIRRRFNGPNNDRGNDRGGREGAPT